MAEFTIDATRYQSRMMDGEVQILVLKRLLPAFAALMGCRSALAAAGVDVSPAAGGGEEGEVPAESSVLAHDTLLPVARELASINDADLKFILDACVEVTKREVAEGKGWVDVRQRGMIQNHNDGTLRVRLAIAWNVLGENFAEVLQSFGIDMADLTKVASSVR